MRAWKYVDEAHAALVAAGSLKLGRASDYRALEGDRQDPYDSGVAVHSGNLDLSRPDHFAAAHTMGVTFGAPAPGTHMWMMGNTTVFRDPVYALCFCEPGCIYEPKDGKPQALFEVLGVRSIARHLERTYMDRLGRRRTGRVAYGQREFMALDAGHPEAGDTFFKASKFAHEREIRVAFDQVEGSEYLGFATGEDPYVASLLRRIR